MRCGIKNREGRPCGDNAMKLMLFLLKKVRKDVQLLVPFVLMGVFILFIYYGNHKAVSIHKQEMISNQDTQIEILRDEVSRLRAQNATNERLQAAQDRLSYTQTKLDALQKQDWIAYYQSEAALNAMLLESYENERSYKDEDVIESLRIQKLYHEYMSAHGTGFDEYFWSVQGFSYMTRVWNDFLAGMMVIVLVFITAKLYCAGYQGKMDIQSILPYAPMKRLGWKLAAGAIIGFCILLFISITSLLCGSVGGALGNLASAILTYNEQGANGFVPLSSLLLKMLLMFSLSILFIVNTVSMIGFLTKKNMVCLLSALAILLGCVWILPDIAPLHSYLHLLPTSYIHSLKVISGELAYTSFNMKITFLNGMIVLTIANALLFFLQLYLPRFWRVKS